MKLALSRFISLATVMVATSAMAQRAERCLISEVSTEGRENPTIVSEAQRCGSALDIDGVTQDWNKTGGFHFANRGIDLFYTTEGSGDPVVLIHGLACDQSDWLFQIPFLLDQGFQVIAIDLRGHGRSSAPAPAVYSKQSSYSYDPKTLTDDTAALMQYLQIGNNTTRGPAIVFGHSLGGVVASELAFHYPDLVRGIVLVDSAYYSPIPAFRQFSDNVKNSPVATAAETASMAFAAMDSPENPAWMAAWRNRRTWGMPGYILSATLEQLVDFLAQWSTPSEYRSARRGLPKLITVAQQSSADLEIEVGLAEEDRVEVLGGGHWLFQANATRFNNIVGEWFTARGFVQTY